MLRQIVNIKGLAILGGILLFSLSGYAQKNSNVVVTNTTTNPVPVKRADNPAFQPFRIGVEWGETKSVPLGKTFDV